jgi:bacteriocin-like protein
MASTFDHSVIELNEAELNEVVGGVSAVQTATAKGGAFEIEDYSFDIEQVLNVGRQ